MSQLKSLNVNDVKLPSPPAIAMRILETVRKEDPSFQDLARIISADPALTAKLLKMANSSFYSLPKQINLIEKALSVIGLDAVKNIALSFVIAKEMRGTNEGKFDFDHFWKRAVTSAVAAELATSLLKVRVSDVFVCGLLQDIGILVMYTCQPYEYMKVLDEKETSERSVQELEREVFGGPSGNRSRTPRGVGTA